MSTDSEGAIALRPRARIMRTLGEELISSETVAVIELVKNSYDADASYVSVSFVGDAVVGEGAIEVWDDGCGMSLDTVKQAWMEPATAFKKKSKTSPRKSRRVLGEKGVGRFASARLASELELATKEADSDQEIYAYFDWTQFDRDDLYLDEILILAEGREPSLITEENFDRAEDGSIHGTVLRMSKLKKTWDDNDYVELRRGLSRLVSPFSADESFKIFLKLPGQGSHDDGLVGPPEILNYPHYAISGTVDAHGVFSFQIDIFATGYSSTATGSLVRLSPKGALSEVADPTHDMFGVFPPQCGPLEFRLLVWDRDQLDSVQQKLGTGLRSIRQDLNAVAGISIYRDGFRVLPYGEPDNDWLRLDMRRVQNPSLRLSNNQLTGFVRISADDNPDLRDQSNREGLDSNDAFRDLQAVMTFVLTKIEVLRFQTRRSAAAGKEANESLLDRPDVSDLRGKLVDRLPDGDEALDLFEATVVAWEQQVVGLRQVLARYHSLATIGQLVDKLVHNTRQPLSKIVGQSSLAAEAIQAALSSAQGSNDPCLKVLRGLELRIDRVKTAAEIIDTVLKRIEPMGGRKKGRPTKVYLEEVIRGAFKLFDGEILESGIDVTLPTSETLATIEPAELQEVLINLLTNSLHWLKSVDKTRRRISVSVARISADSVEIVFADSGPGIPMENRQAVFDPYFTTRPDGVGLGLVLAGEIIRDFYHGSLELLDSKPLDGAVFRIVLNRRVSE